MPRQPRIRKTQAQEMMGDPVGADRDEAGIGQDNLRLPMRGGIPPIASRTFFLTAMRKGYSKGGDPSPNSPPFPAFFPQGGGSPMKNPTIKMGNCEVP